MAALEGAQAARATATGMAAVTTALMGQVKAGDHIVASKALFGSCLYVVEEHLPRLWNRLDAGRRHRSRPVAQGRCDRTPRPFFLETPTNPGLDVLDIKAIAEIAHGAGATLVVDNVFSTPLFQRPLELGADCVVYSATKHIDGQGRCLGGRHSRFRKIHSGPHPHVDPPDRPVAVAVQRLGPAQGAGDAMRARAPADRPPAATVAVALADHPKVSRLIYPGRPGPSAGRDCAPADAGGLDAGSRSRSRAARPPHSASRTRSSSCASATILATPRA